MPRIWSLPAPRLFQGAVSLPELAFEPERSLASVLAREQRLPAGKGARSGQLAPQVVILAHYKRAPTDRSTRREIDNVSVNDSPSFT